MKKRILVILSLLLCFTCVFSCIGCESVDNDETDAIETEKNADDATDKKTEKPTDKVTEAPKATENKATEPEEEKKGCGGTVSVAGLALVAALGTCAVFVEKKRK